MITGRVTDEREATIRLHVRGPKRRRAKARAVIDTGYDGSLTLPVELVQRLQLEWRRRGWAQLADDSEIQYDVYAARVLWDGRWRSVLVDCSGSSILIGMRLLDGYELRLQGRSGGSVVIEALA